MNQKGEGQQISAAIDSEETENEAPRQMLWARAPSASVVRGSPGGGREGRTMGHLYLKGSTQAGVLIIIFFTGRL